MSMLSTFEFESQEIRFVDDMPVAVDVAKALGYVRPSDAINSHVFEINKSLGKSPIHGSATPILLKEAGIYQLIFCSKLPSAIIFQQWVFEQVLPSIRKTGSYNTRQQLHETILELILDGCITDEEKAHRLLCGYLTGVFDLTLMPDIHHHLKNPDDSPLLLHLARHIRQAQRTADNLLSHHNLLPNKKPAV
jgi:prophage antirepressor-like protein